MADFFNESRQALDEIYSNFHDESSKPLPPRPSEKEDSSALIPQKNPQLLCGGCYMPIPSLKQCFYIETLKQHFHPDCFKCIVCQCKFSESVPYIPSDGKAYCQLDFETIFSVTCAGCHQPVQNPIKALGKNWHREHLQCATCHQPIHGQVYEHQGRGYCQMDYAQLFQIQCLKCAQPIRDHPVPVPGGHYHSDCFSCSATGCKASARDSTFYEWNGSPVCKLHFHTFRGTICQKCRHPIEGMCAEPSPGALFHANCWTCSQCTRPLNGYFYLHQGKPVCEEDISRMMGGMLAGLPRHNTLMRNTQKRG